ncbi:type IIA DNA topoisomerase subunit B, partial [bacterium]|nr:type IIA DNA topoisomerase subunit B [bacterium]
MLQADTYNEASVRSLDWKEHIRLRPGMYIGKLGDGSSPDDGIYVLIKEIIDNSIDEFVMGFGKTIEVTITDQQVCVRDYGRGMPLGKLVECVSRINTGAKYDSKVFKKAVGLNGVGAKAVNGLSSFFKAQTIREGRTKIVEFSRGEVSKEEKEKNSDLRTGTIITFTPDDELFGSFHFIPDYVRKMLWNYVFLNTGLTIIFNGEKFLSQNGLLDLLNTYIDTPVLYPVIHIREGEFEFAFTHCEMYGEEYYSFVNGQ